MLATILVIAFFACLICPMLGVQFPFGETNRTSRGVGRWLILAGLLFFMYSVVSVHDAENDPHSVFYGYKGP